jgi:biotin carboxylase
MAAIQGMEQVLRGAVVRGVSTTIPVHLAVLASREFRAGEYDTASLPGWSVR